MRKNRVRLTRTIVKGAGERFGERRFLPKESRIRDDAFRPPFNQEPLHVRMAWLYICVAMNKERIVKLDTASLAANAGLSESQARDALSRFADPDSPMRLEVVKVNVYRVHWTGPKLIESLWSKPKQDGQYKRWAARKVMGL